MKRPLGGRRLNELVTRSSTAPVLEVETPAH